MVHEIVNDIDVMLFRIIHCLKNSEYIHVSGIIIARATRYPRPTYD